MDTVAKTILHYAKKIKEYCNLYDDCEDCPLFDVITECYFDSTPDTWEEVNLHDE